MQRNSVILKSVYMQGLNAAFCGVVLKSKTHFYDFFVMFKTQIKQNHDSSDPASEQWSDSLDLC